MEFNFVKMNKSKQWKTIIDVNEHAILQGEKLAKWQHINHNLGKRKPWLKGVLDDEYHFPLKRRQWYYSEFLF